MQKWVDLNLYKRIWTEYMEIWHHALHMWWISTHIRVYQTYISVYTLQVISVHISAYLFLSKHLCQYLYICLYLFISSISVNICQYLSISVHVSISANMFKILHGDSAWRKCMEIVHGDWCRNMCISVHICSYLCISRTYLLIYVCMRPISVHICLYLCVYLYPCIYAYKSFTLRGLTRPRKKGALWIIWHPA